MRVIPTLRAGGAPAAGTIAAMTSEALLKLVHAQPFRPFTVRLPSGKEIAVVHPDFISISASGRRATIETIDDDFEMVDVLLIESLSSADGGGRRATA